MRQSLNVLPVKHEYAPGEEPSLVDAAVAFFGGEWRTEQFVVFAGLVGFALLVVIYLWTTGTTRRPTSAMSVSDGSGILGSSMRSLRQERMPGGVSRGGQGWQPPKTGGGRLRTHAPDGAALWAAKRRKRRPLDDPYTAGQ